MMMRNSTSGMRLRLKISLNRCAVKINRPIMAMVKPISRDELLVDTCSRTFSTALCCLSVSVNGAMVSVILDSVLVVGMSPD